ncbi:copper fist DNA binding domain-containing protein [Lipomyces tetrasporus]|uniref:Copper fist DNA binding domain-containing protein n=1 Tax=Lipomyces tetrasporus TaxID=54092 RepID=A0AAD7QZ30_9ASCO|nr:copper fist DNA binding domain-containing protein [Lipomyces tetrasporus]KAJ8104105.1 copper fist DNA binding domain-containing protein [Lipomyces tetrasporus]
MVLIDGIKYACDTCIRGHRVTTCSHKDRPLTMIKPKGRPVSQCPHCREARKNHALHTKCDCGDNKSGSSPESLSCTCSHGGKCDCSKLKNAGRATAAATGALEVALKAGHTAGVRNSTIMAKPHLHGSSPYRTVSTRTSPSPGAQVPMTYSVQPAPSAAHQHIERYGSPQSHVSSMSDSNLSSYNPLGVQVGSITRQVPEVPTSVIEAEPSSAPYNSNFHSQSTNTDQVSGGRASTSSASSLGSGGNGYDSESTYSSYSSFDDLTAVGGTPKDILQFIQGDISYSQALPQDGMTNFLEDGLGGFNGLDFSTAASYGLDHTDALFESPELYSSAPATVHSSGFIAPATFPYVSSLANAVTSRSISTPEIYRTVTSSAEYDLGQFSPR